MERLVNFQGRNPSKARDQRVVEAPMRGKRMRGKDLRRDLGMRGLV